MQHSVEIENGDCQKIIDLIQGRSVPKAFYNIGVGQDELTMNEAVFLKQKFPDIEIYGVEANPNFVKIRQENYPGNLLSVGIWSEKCKKTLTVPVAGVGRSSLLPARKEWAESRNFKESETIEVECMTLDDLDKLAGKPEKIWLWMDIEGAELEALKGAEELLKSRRLDCISFEVSTVDFLPGEQLARRHGEPTMPELIDYLGSFGYHVQSILSRASIFANVLFLRKELLQ